MSRMIVLWPCAFLVVSNFALAAPETGAAADVTTSQKRLEAALVELAKAVERIAVDPPAAADLDAAPQALDALKAAIDAGASNEARDLTYAKAALSARKELRSKRDYIEHRRAMVNIHNHRRSIDAALAQAASVAANATDLKAAHEAISALKGALDAARPSTQQDEKFAAYVKQADATVAKYEKATDDRLTSDAVAQLRPSMRERRENLAATLSTLNANATDAQFDAAEDAVKSLSKQLEDGKYLEAKDSAYRVDAERARAEVTDARKKMDALWNAVGVERLKAEIEPAYRDLLAASRVSSAKQMNDEALAELRTASIVVRKLLEKYAPQAARIAAFGAYVGEVNKVLSAVELKMQRRAIDAARRTATNAMQQMTQAAAGIEAVQAAEEAVKQLTAAIDAGAPFAKKDHDYAVYARESKERVVDLNQRIAARKVTLASNDGRRVLGDALAESKLKVANAVNPQATGADVETAATAVNTLTQALETRSALEQQDRTYAAVASKTLGELAKLIEGLELAKAMQLFRKRTADVLASAATVVDGASTSHDIRLKKAQYEGALAQFKSCENTGTEMLQANKALAAARTALEGQLVSTKDLIARCVERSTATTQLLRQVTALVSFQDGPKRAFEMGKSLLSSGKKAEALAQFDDCVASGIILQRRSPELADQKFEVAGTLMTLDELTKNCIGQQRALKNK